MRHRCRFQRWGLQALEILWLLVMSSPLCDAAQRLSVTPPTIKINSFFGGAEVSVSAEIPQGCEAVIEVTGKKLEEDLMRKGRRWDLWMNVGEIDIDGAPCLYLLMSSAPRLLKTGNPTWGYKALSRNISFKGRFKTGEKPELFREFVHLKEGHGLYGVFPDAINIAPVDAIHSMARASFHLPARIPQGVHRVCITVIRDGQPVEQRCVPFTVVLAGLPAFLSFLAYQRVIFYGILSVAVAVAGGFLSGALFKMRRGGKSQKRDLCKEDEDEGKSTPVNSGE
jgi:hypothetical protein